MLGVLAVDMSLDLLSEELQSVKPYPKSFLTILDRNLNFVVHPNKSLIMKGTPAKVLDKQKYEVNPLAVRQQQDSRGSLGDYQGILPGELCAIYIEFILSSFGRVLRQKIGQNSSRAHEALSVVRLFQVRYCHASFYGSMYEREVRSGAVQFYEYSDMPDSAGTASRTEHDDVSLLEVGQ